MDPFTIGAIATAGGNLLTNLLTPSKGQFGAKELRRALNIAGKAGYDNINAGVQEANRSAAAQAAQAGINSPNFLTRMTGLNELRGTQLENELRSNLANQQIGGLSQISAQNLQAGQARANQIGNTLGYLTDPLASMATLQYMVNDPTILSLIRGEVG